MPYDSSELLRLATRLEAAAKVADAKAEQHTIKRELDLAHREKNRADEGRHFASVCKHFASKAKSKQKQVSFSPPSWEELIEFRNEKLIGWPDEDVRQWFNHFNSNGWLVSGKAGMKSWKHAAENGFLRWKKSNTQTELKLAEATGERVGWREFVKKMGKPYVKWKYAPDWMRTEFRKEK